MSRTQRTNSDSVSSDATRTSFIIPPVLHYDNADASLVASALHSPTHSGVEVHFSTVVFSRNGSFSGSARGERPASADGGAPPAGDHAPRKVSAPADSDGGEVVVDPRPAIIGYFGSSFGSGICAFYSQIFTAKGLTADQIGFLVAFSPFFSMTLLPVLSYLVDKFRCETKMMLASLAVTSAAMIGYTMASPRYLVVFFFLVMAAARTIIGPLLDQQILMMFPRKGRSSAWSYVRSYAAYGWGIGCFASSLLYSWTGVWVAVALQYAVGQLGLVYCMLVSKPYEKIEKTPVRFKEVLQLLGTNKRVMLFLFAATMMGTGYSFIDNFLFIFLDDLHGSKVLMGLTVVLTVSTEIPLFQNSEKLHKMFTERHMMSIAMGVWTFRVVCYSLLRNPWWVLLIEPLHGVTFSFMWLPSVHLIARAFPPKLSSSATGVLFTLTSGVGPMVGSPVAGQLYKWLGPRKMFLCAAAAMGLSLAFYLVMDNVLERRGVPIVCDYDAAEAAATAVTVTADADARDDEPVLPPPTRKRPQQSESEGANGGRRAAQEELLK